MFYRMALVPLGLMEAPTGEKIVFASNDNADEVTFPFDPQNFVYFRCRAITADVSNGNGDYFPEEEVIKAYKTFIGAGLYKDHQSDSVDKSIGKVLWAEWVPSEKYVECYCAVDKVLAPELAHRVKMGLATSVSMGCSVAEAQCSVCNNIAHNVNELCPCMTPGFGQKGRHGSDGKIIYEINRGIQFNELSLVTVPADSTARIFEIYASLKKQASSDVLRNVKSIYSMISFPEMFNNEFTTDEVAMGKSKGKGIRTYDDSLLNTYKARAEEQLKSLTPEELVDLKSWISVNKLPSGLLGNETKTEGSEVRPLWELAMVDYSGDNKAAVNAFRKIDEKFLTNKDRTYVPLASKYYEAIDKAMNFARDLKSKESGLPPEQVEANKSEMESLFKDAFNMERTLQSKCFPLYRKMQDAYDNYKLYRGVEDSKSLGDANLPPLGPIAEDFVRKPEADKKVRKWMSGFKKAEHAYSTIGNSDTFVDQFNKHIDDENKKIPEGGISKEVALRNLDINEGEAVAADPFAFYDEVEKNLGSVVKDGNETRTVPENVSVALNKKKESKERKKIRDTQKAQDISSQTDAIINKPGEAAVAPAPVDAKVSKEDADLEELFRKIDEGAFMEGVEEAKAKGWMDKVIYHMLNVPDLPFSDLEGLGDKNPDLREKIRDGVSSKDSELGERLTKRYKLPSNGSGNEPVVASSNKVVIKIHNSTEDRMSLSIGYTKGTTLSSSYFTAKEGSLVYRVAASEVLPLPVQESIMLNDVRVAGPDQLVADFSTKFSKLEDFKRWAKKRKKKNKKALLKLMPREDLANRMQEPVSPKPIISVEGADNGRNNEMLKTDNALPKTAAQDEKPVAPVAVVETVTPVVESKPVTTESETLVEIKAAFSNLAKFMESKLKANAVKKLSIEPKIDGKAKSQEAPEPKGAINEIVKTENPKGFVDTSSLKAQAMDENWTVNQKELENEPKMTSDVEISMDKKEMASEEVSVKNSNKAAGKVKKYYGQLGAGAEGTPEVAMDLKSSENGEVKLLRAALAKEQESNRLRTVADKIYGIVATLQKKNLITAGKEDIIVDTLTKRFADVAALENLAEVVDKLESKDEVGVSTEISTESKVIPQVFDTIEKTEDSVALMSEIWNK